jgi:putative CRISPR-associated protein (TIGR02619 family)
MDIIISPVGTSVLTNGTTPELRSLLEKYANYADASQIDKADLQIIKAHIGERVRYLQKAAISDLKSVSAELNGIISLYGNKLQNRSDIMHLVCSDTYIGKETCSMIETALSGISAYIIIHCIPGLQTMHNQDLRDALSVLVREIDTIYQSRSFGQRIIFNLTGGFKAIQGFLQTLGMFYADETVYIFQTSSELMRIPRLPVKFVAMDYIKDKTSVWRCLEMALPIDPADLTAIPDIFYYRIDNEFCLSEYGELVWLNLKREIYGQELLPNPIERIKYSKTFTVSVEHLSPDRMTLINQRIDDLATYIFTNGKKNPDRLNFKKLEGKSCHPSTHEIYAWSDQGAERIILHKEADTYVLDKLIPHL